MNDAFEFAQYKAQIITDLVHTHHLPCSKIIDMGCGDGIMAYYLQQYLPESKIIGYESCFEKKNLATELNPEMSFIYAPTIADIQIADIDIIVLSLVLHHIPHIQQFLHDIALYLKPKNIIILEFNAYRPDIWFLKYTDPEEYNAHFITPKKLNQIALTYQLKTVALNWHIKPFLGHLAPQSFSYIYSMILKNTQYLTC